jgi:hypothetical protein
MPQPTPLLSLACSLLLGPPEPAAAPEYEQAIVIEAAPHVAPPDPTSSVEPPLDPSLDPSFDPSLDPSFDPSLDPADDPTAWGGARPRSSLPPPPPPPDGSGRIVGGTLAMGLGVAAFAVVSIELRRTSDANATYVTGTFVPLGIAALGIGTYTVVRGSKARANYNFWKSFTGLEPPRQGGGLLVGGTMTSAIGVVMLATGVARAARGDQDTSATLLMSLGGAGVATGALQLGLGLARRQRHERWLRRGLVQLAPSVGPTPRGGWLVGVAGRF